MHFDIQSFFNPQTLDVVTKLAVAMFLGMFIGAERMLAGKTAGMRTYALVSMGSALFLIIAGLAAGAGANFDASAAARIMAAIITGVGFLGSGLVFKSEKGLVGITSASGLWVCTGVGMAVGLGFTNIAIIATTFTLFIFVAIAVLQKRIRHWRFDTDEETMDADHVL